MSPDLRLTFVIGRLVVFLLVLLLLQGCASTSIDVTAYLDDQPLAPLTSSAPQMEAEATLLLRRPYRETFQCISDHLRRDGIANESYDTLTGTWRVRDGQKRGLWIWRKTWRQRVRVIVFVRPGVLAAESFIEIRAESEERPNENYPWVAVQARENAELVATRLAVDIRRKCGI